MRKSAANTMPAKSTLKAILAGLSGGDSRSRRGDVARGDGTAVDTRRRGFDDFSFSDIFSDVFGASQGGRREGQGFAARGQDLRYSLEVDFLEAVLGAKKRVTFPDGGVLDLVVPEGVTDGQVCASRAKARLAPGSESGDALVEIRVRPHAEYRRDGDDILLELPITIDEAVLGGRVQVPTPTGRVQLTIPKGTSSGQTFRLKGKGVRSKAGTVGDQLVTVKIVVPPEIDESLSYFFSEWRQKHGYDPGRKYRSGVRVFNHITSWPGQARPLSEREKTELSTVGPPARPGLRR